MRPIDKNSIMGRMREGMKTLELDHTYVLDTTGVVSYQSVRTIFGQLKENPLLRGKKFRSWFSDDKTCFNITRTA